MNVKLSLTIGDANSIVGGLMQQIEMCNAVIDKVRAQVAPQLQPPTPVVQPTPAVEPAPAAVEPEVSAQPAE